MSDKNILTQDEWHEWIIDNMDSIYEFKDDCLKIIKEGNYRLLNIPGEFSNDTGFWVEDLDYQLDYPSPMVGDIYIMFIPVQADPTGELDEEIIDDDFYASSDRQVIADSFDIIYITGVKDRNKYYGKNQIPISYYTNQINNRRITYTDHIQHSFWEQMMSYPYAFIFDTYKSNPSFINWPNENPLEVK